MEVVDSADASAPEEKPSGAVVGDGVSPAPADGGSSATPVAAAPAAAAAAGPARDEDLTKVRNA